MFENDFIMREIENFTRFAAEVLLNKKSKNVDIKITQQLNTKANSLKQNLHNLVADGKINEAENKLFDIIEESPIEENLKVALDFYHELSTLDKSYLRSCNFTEDEILDGLHELQKIYGIDQNLLNLFSRTKESRS